MKSQAEIVQECYEGWLATAFDNFRTLSKDGFESAKGFLDKEILNAKRCRDYLLSLGMDVRIKINERVKESISMKACKVKAYPKNSGMRADQPGVKWSTLSAGIEIEFVDADGNAVPGITADQVTSSLSVDDNNKVIITKVDELNYSITKGTAIRGNVLFTCNAAKIDGTAGPFVATLPVELDASAPTDIRLKILGNA